MVKEQKTIRNNFYPFAVSKLNNFYFHVSYLPIRFFKFCFHVGYLPIRFFKFCFKKIKPLNNPDFYIILNTIFTSFT